jgi:hypothetical protein
METVMLRLARLVPAPFLFGLSFSFFLFFLHSGATAGVTIQPESQMLAFGGSEITAALKDRGEEATVVVGTYAWLADKQGVTPPPDAKEAYAVTKTADGRIIIAGQDEAGAMYGALEAAEQIRVGGAQSVSAKSAKPFLPVRQYKYNIPEIADGQEYFHTEEYWRGFFDLLARARFNSIGFWQHHPFSYMITFERFPEAAVLTPEQTQRNIKTFSMIFRLAKERNIQTFIINWNIHISPKFAQFHKIPTDGYDSPLVREYMRYCVAQTLRTYPDLTGLGVCAGEHMPSEDYDWREQWVKDTFVAGVKDSGRVVPLIHRYWWAAPDSIQRIIAADYPGQVFVEIKYNGEHMYSGLRPHFLDADWIDFPDYKKYLSRDPKKPVPNVGDHLQWIRQTPRNYQIMWHLRNDCMFLFRWGDPEFVRQVVRNSHPEYTVGFLMGEEMTQPGVDKTHTEQAQAHQTWKYEYERHWFRFLLWGRLGYDPTIPDDHWRALFRSRFGKAGDDLYGAYAQSSVVIPTITRFHFNYMNGDWQPEWCWGSWNTGFGRGRNYRDRRGFHDVIEFAFNHTIEDGILDIAEYVGMSLRGEQPPQDALSPLQVADQLEAASQAAAAAVERIRAQGEQTGEAACYAQEFAATAALGGYYAEKIRGATELMHFFATGETSHRDAAVAHLRAATGHWRRFVELSVPHYRRASSGPSGCERNLRMVERDILLAETAQAAPDALAKLGVLQRAAQRPHFDFTLVSDLVSNSLAPDSEPIMMIDRVDLSPATCDFMILGKEAWKFNALPAEKKRVVLDAVDKGVNLVLFFQNFPKFDASWLPGGIGSRDKDSNEFQWTEVHPITSKVDPSALAGRAVVNDALTGGDAEWKNLTEPCGGLMLRQQGKGQIIFCQLDVLHRYKEPGARQLIENILAFAAGGRKKPRIVILDAGSGTIAALDKMKVPVMWLDELPVEEKKGK